MTIALTSALGVAVPVPPSITLGFPLLASPTAQPDNGPDAEIVALGDEFDRAVAALSLAQAECKRVGPIFHDAISQLCRETGRDPTVAELSRLGETTGNDAAADREDDALDRVRAIGDAIRDTPASTFVGLAVWAKAAVFECVRHDQRSRPEDEIDWDAACFTWLAKEIERLADLQARGP